MGIARIMAGGTDGRYTVKVDYGDSAKQNNLVLLDRQDAAWAVKQAEAEKKYKTANDEYQAIRTGYVNALNSAIDTLNFAMQLPSVAEIQAKATATKAAAKAKYDDATALHTTRLAELQAAQGALASIKTSLTTAQEQLVQAQEAQAEGQQLVQQAENQAVALANVAALHQQQTAEAEAAYAAALISGVGIEDARLIMQARQTQLSETLKARAQALQDLAERVQDLQPLIAAVTEAQEAADVLENQQASAQDTLDLAVEAEQGALANKQVATAELERASSDAAAILSQSSRDGALASAKQNVLAAQSQLAQLDIANAPQVLELKRTVTGIKLARSQIADMRQRWVDAEMVETKTVWCVDLTENGAGDVATIDINGESQLQLLAPGCRAWQASDGAISVERKNEGVAQLSRRVAIFADRVTTLTAQITEAEAKEQRLKTAMEELQAQYKAAPSESRPALSLRVSAASLEYHDQMAVVRNLKMRKVDAQARVAEAELTLLRWNDRLASDEPNPGDGALLHPVAQSPWQSFVNLAIHPGWQRHMPTYRWGTALAVYEDRNTIDVQLAPAASSVQGLDINKATVLRQVPVEYMTCNASVFEEDDRVVVKFKGQDWTKPVVIGFLDEPKSCQKFLGFFRPAYDNTQITQEKHKNRFWDDVTAEFPIQPRPFRMWSDGVLTRLRPKQKVTESISVSAAYYTFPTVIIQQAQYYFTKVSAVYIYKPDNPGDSHWIAYFKRTVVLQGVPDFSYGGGPWTISGYPAETIEETRGGRWNGLEPNTTDAVYWFPDTIDIPGRWPTFDMTLYDSRFDRTLTCRYGLRSFGYAYYIPLEVTPFLTG
jgi:hypothetical protein